jgi:hypothetical protein
VLRGIAWFFGVFGVRQCTGRGRRISGYSNGGDDRIRCGAVTKSGDQPIEAHSEHSGDLHQGLGRGISDVTGLDKRCVTFSDASQAVELAGSYCNLGNGFLVHRQQPAESLPWYDKAVARLTSTLAAQPDLATARAFLRNSY